MRNLTLLVVVTLAFGCGGEPPMPMADAGGCDRASDCDDGLFCNGAESCDEGACSSGAAPCADECNEGADTCEMADCDNDGDGLSSVACGGSDCDDEDAMRFPGAVEVCDVSHDEDCNPATVGVDRDGDGFASDTCCNDDLCGLDCNDTLPGVFPGANETCNGRDDDCDGETDEGVLRAFYPDTDGDGFGDRNATAVMACNPPTVDHVEDARDCNDDEVLANPSTSEGCDGIDNDCDGATDEAGVVRWYRDSDSDTFGDANDFTDVTGCAVQAGRALSSTDCDDSNGSIHPGAAELCDRVDSDCSYVPDRGGVDPGEDRDQDGHAPSAGVCVGGLPKDDCDDSDDDAFPGNPQRCSGTDQDCDTQIDEDAATFCGAGMTCDGTCVSTRGLSGWNGSETFFLTSPFEGFAVDHHAFQFCALREGVPHCWGNPCDNGGSTFRSHCSYTVLPNGEHPLHATRISGLPGLAQEVTTGLSHACARVSGRVYCWGTNAEGELGNGTTVSSATPVAVQLPADDAVALSAGDAFTCAIRRNRSVWCWGTGDNAAIGSPISFSSTPVAVANVADAIAISSGRRHTCVRHDDGGMSCWGDNNQGQTGGSAADFQLAARVAGLTDVRAISAGIEGTCALRGNGAIQCFGAALEDALVSTDIDALAMSQYCVAGHRTDDGVEAFGRSTRGCRAVPSAGNDDEDATLSDTLAGLASLEVAGSRKVLCARDQDEDVRCWGLFAGRYQGFVASTLTGYVEVATGFDHTCARTAAGRVHCVGRISQTDYRDPFDMGLEGVTSLATAGHMSCAVLADGTVQCWGNGSVSVDSSTYYAPSPIDVGDVGHAVEVALDGADSADATGCVRRMDGTIRCWGYSHNSPADITLPVGAVPTQISVSDAGGCARLASGEVACWGTGSWRPPGAELTGAALVPGLSDVLEVAMGDVHVCVLHSGGTVSCWGGNGSYQLGDGTNVSASTPQPLSGLSDIVQIAAGGNSTCARTSAGGALCWGTVTRWQDPPFGSVPLEYETPTVMLGLAVATDIDGGRHGACAIAAGRVHCMGSNESERFGLGALADVVFP